MSPQPSKTTPNTSPKSQEQQQNPDANPKQQQFQFVYRGTKYDCTDYAQKHPGGIEFFEKFIEEKEEINEYFDTLHSNKARAILKSQPKVESQQKYALTKDNLIYDELLEKVKHLYAPNYPLEFAVLSFNLFLFYLGLFASNPIINVLCLAWAQTLIGWLGHSWLHTRDPLLNFLGQNLVRILGGMSPIWWNRKHNLHHMFTNNLNKDEDIQHHYNRLLFCLLWLKWKFDSILADYKNPLHMIRLFAHFYILSYQKWYIVLIAFLFSGHLTAIILVGNHENEKIIEGKIGMNFIPHQIITTRNYNFKHPLWLSLFGGMQFQTEHHFFPQIPFYNLPASSDIIQEHLNKYNIQIKTDAVL